MQENSERCDRRFTALALVFVIAGSRLLSDHSLPEQMFVFASEF